MKLNQQKCKEVGTELVNVPNGAIAIMLKGRMKAYRRNPTSRVWDWIHKDFQKQKAREEILSPEAGESYYSQDQSHIST